MIPSICKALNGQICIDTMNGCSEQGENGTGMAVRTKRPQRVIICSKVDCKYVRTTESTEKCVIHLKTEREKIQLNTRWLISGLNPKTEKEDYWEKQQNINKT